ncbi:DUF2755 family protein [Cronobacter sakazakii]
MAEISLPKPIIAGKPGRSTALGNIGYALFVLFSFWVGAQLLNVVVHAPGVLDNLMQMQESGRPQIKMGLAVGTIFALVPFLAGCVFAMVMAFFFRLRRRRF